MKITEEQIRVLNLAIIRYGPAAQLDMVIEEMSELTKEICKRKRGSDNRFELIDEIADVLIMIEQLKMIYNIDNEAVIDRIEIKVNRLNDRLMVAAFRGDDND